VESLRRKGFAPNQYAGANPYRQSLQLWRDLLWMLHCNSGMKFGVMQLFHDGFAYSSGFVA
jgi:hypothetical protein